MPNLILDLMVDRVDLVDEGANSAAFIKLYKRKETDLAMDLNEILAKMKPEHKAIIEAELEKAKTEVPADTVTELQNVTKAKNDLQTELDTVKSALEAAEIAKSKENKEPDFEEVLKGLDPSVQAVFKSLQAQKEAAEVVAREASEKALTDEAIAKAKELKSIPVEEATLVNVLKGITPEVHDILKAANKAIEDGGVFEELGKGKTNGEGGTDAWDQIEKKAQEIEESEKVSKQKSIAMAIKQNPELYREYLKGGTN